MLTVREYEAAITEMLKASPVAVAHILRTLKEAGLSARVGRGHSEVRLSPSHPVNAVLAFVGGTPIEAPATVALLRALQVDYIRHPAPDGRPEYYGGGMHSPVEMCGLIIYPTLGETLDRLARVADEYPQVGRVITVEIHPEGSIEAWIKVVTGAGTYSASFALMDMPTKNDAPKHEVESGPLMISRTVTLHVSLFKRMAKLLEASASGSVSQQLNTDMPDENADLPARKSAPVPNRAAQKQPAASTVRKTTRAARNNQSEPKGSPRGSLESDPASRRSP